MSAGGKNGACLDLASSAMIIAFLVLLLPNSILSSISVCKLIPVFCIDLSGTAAE